MRIRTLMFVICCAAFAACGGCDDETSGNNTTSSNNSTTTTNSTTGDYPDGCVDEDGDGHPTGLTCDGVVDCDDGDPTVHPGVEEECYDEVDNDCDGAVDEGCPECDEGATRACGTDEGRCVAGSQSCVDAKWTDCVGAEGPFSETCNGEDDDCDGEIDENGELLCDDGLSCNGAETCTAGACAAGEAVDCTMLDGPCLVGMCSEKDRGCRAFPIENGTACDDGLFCTENGVCDAGECVVTPKDCSTAGDECNTGVCDEAADACVPQPVSDGTVCNDGMFCTTTDTCTAGVCGGPMRDCSSAADQCNSGVCDDTVDACVPAPVTDGTSCEDGQYCTVGDACMAGTCTGGGARQCGATGGSCRDGVCDETLDACTGNPVPDGTSCDDGQFCTTADACVAGNCMGGGARDCSSAAGLCKVGSCNEAVNQCVPLPAPDGTACDDGAFCTVSDTCTAGACGGSMRNCTAAGDECNVGVCDDTANSCVPQPASDGTACADSLFCTTNEICVAGSCNRAQRDCTGTGNDCNDGICDEAADACAAQPKADGTVCNDNLFCTTGDACQAGTCTGGPTSCSQFDDQCTVGACDEMMNTCEAAARPDNTPCDDTAWCTENDVCGGGVCSGAPRNCSLAGDQCNNGICDEATDACVGSPRPDGTACDDSDFCTVSDACTAGTCGGPPRDCSGVADGCNDGVCTQAGCVPSPKANGTACTLPAYCLVNTVCDTGTCVGDQRDCSGATMGDMCLDGVCDDAQDMCITVDNGTCDLCNPGAPTAVATVSSNSVPPNTTVTFDGTGSTDPSGQALTYSWQVTARPSGSTAQLSSTTSATPTLLGDVSGDFTVCLTITDTDSCVSTPSCVTFTVEPIVDLHIELVWFSDDSDLDLHYQMPPYAVTDWFSANACWYAVPNPNWPGPDDPILDVDNTAGFGPENINQASLVDGNPFTIGVHNYLNSDASLAAVTGDVSARVRVYSGSNLLFERTRSVGCREFWEVAEINVTGGTPSVSLKNTITTVSQGICRCNSNADCPSGESCVSARFRVRGGPPITADICN